MICFCYFSVIYNKFNSFCLQDDLFLNNTNDRNDFLIDCLNATQLFNFLMAAARFDSETGVKMLSWSLHQKRREAFERH